MTDDVRVGGLERQSTARDRRGGTVVARREFDAAGRSSLTTFVRRTRSGVSADRLRARGVRPRLDVSRLADCSRRRLPVRPSTLVVRPLAVGPLWGAQLIYTHIRTDSSGMEGSEASDGLLDVLGDSESRALLVALRRESQSAKELGETADLSLPTVYRRLDRLGEFDLVTSTTEVRADGSHYRQYECAFDQTTVSLSPDGFHVTLSLDDEAVAPEQTHSGDD